ncbi:MAG: hypothetical protein J6V40_04245, partial [Clostridia bacterium]|nr:hypothetical protein [Clostridia bacterium]
AVSSTIDRVQTMLDKEYADAKAYKVDDNKIRVVLPDTVIDSHYVVGLLEMKAVSGEESEAMVTGQDIKECKYMYSNGTHGVYIKFTDDGAKKFENLTRTVAAKEDGSDGSMYVYMDKNYDTPFSQPTVDEAITMGYTFISGAGITNKSTGEAYAEKMMSSVLGVNMTIEGEAIEVAPVYGEEAKVVTLIIAVFFILVVLGLFYLLFKELGFIEMLSYILSVLISIAIVCIVDVQVTSYGVMGLLLGFMLCAYLHIVYINNIKAQYAMGKKLSISIKEGYTKSLALIIETLLVSLGLALIIGLIGSNVVTTMALTFGLTLIGTAFTSLFVNRVLVVSYNAFNLSDGKKIGFTKEGKANETK